MGVTWKCSSPLAATGSSRWSLVPATRCSLLAVLLRVILAALFLAANAEQIPRKLATPPSAAFCCQTTTQYNGGAFSCIPPASLPGSDTPAKQQACVSATPPGDPSHSIVPNRECKPCASCCNLAAGACGDPHITGFDGSSYLLYGKANTTYSLISEAHHQVNLRLYQPPGMTDGHALYIEAVGVMIHDTRISVHLVPGFPASMAVTTAGTTASWPGHPVTRAITRLTGYSFHSEDHVTINGDEVGLTVLLVDNNHLDVGTHEVVANWRNVHGIMGQTHALAFRIKYSFTQSHAIGAQPGTTKEQRLLKLQGSEDDYVVTSLFGTDSKFNRFRHDQAQQPTRRLRAASAGGGSYGGERPRRVKTAGGGGVSMTTRYGVPQLAPQRKLLQAVATGTYYSCQP